MVYGRRKTGKTFAIMSFLKDDYYFFVKRIGVIMIRGDKVEMMDYNEFVRLFSELIDRGVKIVVDEFQRLPHDFLHLLHALSFKRKGRLILLGSSMRTIKVYSN